MTKPEENNSLYLVAGAIVVAGLIIAGAVIYSGGGDSSSSLGSAQDNLNGSTVNAAENVKPISAEDHILGNPNAPIKVIEFSDLECPACKFFHEQMVGGGVVDEYVDTGKVAWVYRHWPLSIHPKALTEANAAECVAELGGNDAFWTFINKVFEVTPSNNGLDLSLLPGIAAEAGVNQAQFEECLSETPGAERIQANIDDAKKSGGTGTPFFIVITPDGEYVGQTGAPYADGLKATFDALLENTNLE